MSDEENKKFLEEYASLVAICFFIGVTTIFVVSSYLNQGSFQYFISFHGADGPAGYADSVKPNGFGDHFFGDYLLPRWWSQSSSPWLNDDVSVGPINNYLPFSIAVVWTFSHVSYWLGFVLFAIIPIFVLFYVLWKVLEFWEPSKRVHYLSTVVVFTLPFISVIDRGNIQLYLIASLALSLYLFSKGHTKSAAVDSDSRLL